MEDLNQSTTGAQQYQQLMNKPISLGEWFVTLLIAAIPLVGFIMLFVWAFSGNTNVNKANWAKATLLWMAVLIVLGALFFGAFAAFFSSMFQY
jgi:ABC-type Na+ efflux pump permease subunit